MATSKAMCPMCNELHDVFESEYIRQSVGNVILREDIAIGTEVNEKNIKKGPVICCDGVFYAIGRTLIETETMDLSNEPIRFD